MTRIYKLRGFARFQRKERISDALLRKAINGVEAGLIHADLGGGLVKQRLPRPGQGKSGGYRTVIAIKRGDRAVFCMASPRTNAATSTPTNWKSFDSWRGLSLA